MRNANPIGQDLDDDNGRDDTDLPDKREKAMVTVTINDMHTICFYRPTATKDARFEATCRDPNHKSHDGKFRCRLTRFLSSANADKPESRPCGHLMAWLEIHSLFGSQEEHQSELYVKSIHYDDKCAGREKLRGLPNGPLLLSKERARLSCEPDEPIN